MAKKYVTNIDLASNEIQNVNLQNLAAAPGSPTAGRAYFDTVLKKARVYSGTGWESLGESSPVGEAEAAKLGTIEVKGDLGGSGISPTVVHFTLGSDASANAHKITALAEPTVASDAATKAYVDGKVNGLSWKGPVKVATIAALPAVTAAGTGAAHTLTANANGILTVDGVNVETLGQRVLVKNQAAEKDNGIYTLTTKGEAGAKFVLTRAEDATTEAQVLDATVMAEEGTNEDHVFNMTANPGAAVVDTNNLPWVEIQSGTAVVGDNTYTKRTANQIVLIFAEAAAAEPAEGSVAAISKGSGRKVICAFNGNGTLEEFTITHELKTRNIFVQGQENNAGNPSKPIELDWEPSGAEKVIIKFPTKVAAKTVYHVTVWG